MARGAPWMKHLGAGWMHTQSTNTSLWAKLRHNPDVVKRDPCVKAMDTQYSYMWRRKRREGWFWKHLANRSAFWLIAERHTTDQVANSPSTTIKAEDCTCRRGSSCLHWLSSVSAEVHRTFVYQFCRLFGIFTLTARQALRRGSRCSSSANSCRAPRAKRSLSWRASSQPKRAMAASV